MLNRILGIIFVTFTSLIIAFGQSNRPIIYVPYDFGIPRLSVIDAMTLSEIDQIPLEATMPRIVVLRPDRKIAFIADNTFNSKGLSIVNLQNKTFLRRFESTAISGLKMGPDGKLYVLTLDPMQVVRVNAETYEIEKRLSINVEPASIAFVPNSNRALVLAGVRQTNANEQLIDIDLSQLQITSTLPINPTGYLFGNNEIAISPDGNIAYVAVDRKVLIINLSSFSISSNELPGTRFTQNLQISPDGKTLYVLDASMTVGDPRVLKVDITSRSIIKEKNFGTTSYSFMDLSPDGRLLYVNSDTSLLIAIDTSTFEYVGFFDPVMSGFGGQITLDGDFSLGAPPTVNFIAPGEGSNLIKGKPFTVRWEVTPGSATIPTTNFALNPQQLDLSTDGGSTFITLAQKLLPTVQQFDYNVPLNPSFNNAQFRITVNDVYGLKAIRTVNFSVGDVQNPGDTQNPSVSFIKPSGGEKFAPGDTISIAWTSTDNVGVSSQDLTLSTDGGVSFPLTIATGLNGSIQSFNYQIPSSLQTSAGRFRLVVRDAAGNLAQTMTASNFQVQNTPPPPDTLTPIVTISSPSGNSFLAGQAITVNWESVDNVGVMSQELLLSLDGGAFQSVAVFNGTTSSFTLSGLDKTISVAQVKITATDTAGNKGEQTANFMVVPAIDAAAYAKPILTVSGVGFIANESISSLKVVINGKEVMSKFITLNNNTSITLKGNKKKLGIVKGSNAIKVMVNDIQSKEFNFNF